MNQSDPNGLNWTKWNNVDQMDKIGPNRTEVNRLDEIGQKWI